MRSYLQMHFTQRFLILSLLLTSTSLLVTFIPKPLKSDRYLRELVACTSPCWFTVQPGVTTSVQLKGILEKLEVTNEVGNVESVGDYLYIIDGANRQLDQTIIWLQRGVVSSIQRQLSSSLSPTVGVYIESLGTPEFVVQPQSESGLWEDYPVGGPFEQFDCPDTINHSVLPSHSDFFQVGLVYPQQGVTLWVVRANWFVNAVCPDFVAFAVAYFEESSLESLESMEYHALYVSSNKEYAIYPWVGYGAFYGLEQVQK